MVELSHPVGTDAHHPVLLLLYFCNLSDWAWGRCVADGTAAEVRVTVIVEVILVTWPKPPE